MMHGQTWFVILTFYHLSLTQWQRTKTQTEPNAAQVYASRAHPEQKARAKKSSSQDNPSVRRRSITRVYIAQTTTLLLHHSLPPQPLSSLGYGSAVKRTYCISYRRHRRRRGKLYYSVTIIAGNNKSEVQLTAFFFVLFLSCAVCVFGC